MSAFSRRPPGVAVQLEAAPTSEIMRRLLRFDLRPPFEVHLVFAQLTVRGRPASPATSAFVALAREI